jgi:hypothetical protein
MPKDSTTEEVSTGVCSFCKGEFEKKAMLQHLKSCEQRKAQIEAEETGKARKPKKTPLFHILVEGTYLPMYWMHLEMPASATLQDLDNFLRAVWLECCNHLSSFKIGDTFYEAEPLEFYFVEDAPAIPSEEEVEEGEIDIAGAIEDWLQLWTRIDAQIIPPDLLAELKKPWENVDDIVAFLHTQINAIPKTRRGINTPEGWKDYERRRILRQMLEGLLEMLEDTSMYNPLEKVLKVGQKFTHQYDFGSTTYLSLKVISKREGVAHKGKKAIQVLASNNPPLIPCRKCGQPAVVCEPGYYSAWDSALCQKCAKKGTSEWAYEEMMPIVNSPRTGVCGYTG